MDIAVSNLNETKQFDNDYEGITSAVRYIAAGQSDYRFGWWPIADGNVLSQHHLDLVAPDISAS